MSLLSSNLTRRWYLLWMPTSQLLAATTQQACAELVLRLGVCKCWIWCLSFCLDAIGPLATWRKLLACCLVALWATAIHSWKRLSSSIYVNFIYSTEFTLCAFLHNFSGKYNFPETLHTEILSCCLQLHLPCFVFPGGMPQLPVEHLDSLYFFMAS